MARNVLQKVTGIKFQEKKNQPDNIHVVQESYFNRKKKKKEP